MYGQKHRSERRSGCEGGGRKQPLGAGRVRKQSLPKREQTPDTLTVAPVKLTSDFRSPEL